MPMRSAPPISAHLAVRPIPAPGSGGRAGANPGDEGIPISIRRGKNPVGKETGQEKRGKQWTGYKHSSESGNQQLKFGLNFSNHLCRDRAGKLCIPCPPVKTFYLVCQDHSCNL